MSGPITQNLETENYVRPSSPIAFEQTGTGNAGHLSNTWNINSPLPWIALIAILSGLSLGLAIGARDAANHALKIAERETRLQRLEVDELKVALQTQGIKIHEGSTP